MARADFVQGGPLLRKKILTFAPRIACFVGVVGFRAAFDRRAQFGVQSLSPGWGKTKIFIAPSTSPRNAYYRPQVVEWFNRLRQIRDELNT